MHPKSMVKRQDLFAIGIAVAFLLSAMAFLSAMARADGEPARGRARSQMCEGCHGIADYRTAYPDVYPVPKIGGQQAAYIVKTLNDYKNRARKHPTMHGIAAALTEHDLGDLAAYYAGDARK